MLDKQVGFLEKVMDVSALKRKTIADNISNYNTPGFKATKVEFDQLFEQTDHISLKQTNDKHIPLSKDDGKITLVKDINARERFDGNNVDLVQEMTDMVKNNFVYNTAVQSINKEFSLHKLAMTTR